MRITKMLMPAAVLLLMGSVALAQSEGSKAKQMMKDTTLTGCLSKGTGDHFMLTDEDGEEVMVMGPAKLSEHAGHKVKLTGQWEGKEDAKMFKASKIEHISEHCEPGR